MTETAPCVGCGGVLAADAPEGLCPECLLREALAGPGPAPDEPARSPAPVFVPPAPEELANRFPNLEILEQLGQGGMGAVYKARQPKLDRLVAVKILPPEVARDPAFAERFTREARSLARLNHPNIVTIYDFGESDGLYYFTMEYVDGANVRTLLDAGKLDPERALQVVAQVCDALQYAHDEGVVHRDIKPENLLLDRKGRVKIADFGLARIVGLTPAYLTLTATHEVMGTLYYMAPEQLKRSHTVDHRADLYSLGVVFYEMLTGELPLGRFAPPSHKAPVGDRIDGVVLRALAREPEHRYQDAGTLRADVEAARGSPARAETPAPAGGPKGAWPIVRFTIPEITWAGGEAWGEVYRDDEALILEFRTRRYVRATETCSVRIPFSEITSISCQSEPWTRHSGVPKWMRKFGKTELVIKVARSALLGELPPSKQGHGRLLVNPADKEAAQQLVESIVHRPAAVPRLRRNDDRPEAPVDPEKVRMELMASAIGLLLAGALTLLAGAISVTLVAVIAREPSAPWVVLVTSTLLVPVGVLLLAGAGSMLGMRHYSLALTASIIALLPLTPAWPLGLPCGIVALVSLRRKRVMNAFLLRQRKPPTTDPRTTGPFRAFFRSLGGHMLPTFARRAPTPPSGDGDASGKKPAPAAPAG